MSTPSGPYSGDPYPPQQPYQPYPAQQYPAQYGGAPQYPPPYPGGPYPGGPQYPPPRTTNGFAVASLILSIIGALLFSIVFGFVALSQIKRTGQAGRGMAIAGLAVSGAWILIVGAVITIAAVSPHPTSSPVAGGVIPTTTSGSPFGGLVPSGQTSIDDLSVGDCVSDLGDSAATATKSVTVVACSEPHIAELFAVIQLEGAGAFPGRDAVHTQSEAGCDDRAATYSPTGFQDGTVHLYMLVPISDGWAQGDRTTDCFAKTDTARTGSIQGK